MDKITKTTKRKKLPLNASIRRDVENVKNRLRKKRGKKARKSLEIMEAIYG